MSLGSTPAGEAGVAAGAASVLGIGCVSCVCGLNRIIPCDPSDLMYGRGTQVPLFPIPAGRDGGSGTSAGAPVGSPLLSTGGVVPVPGVPGVPSSFGSGVGSVSGVGR